jgi:endonuclease/exonuclease/phosphatase family metal-dependent hydrolase
MDGGRIRAMTWNLWWRFGPRWTERQPGLLETIRRFNPDVLALQEVWGDKESSQAEQIADALGASAAYAEPSYPAVPEPPRTQDDEGVTLGVALVSRWPITARRVEQLPARHRSWSPVALAATIDHPAGPLHVVVCCLEHGIPYSDDRLAQAAFLAELATRPELDGPCPVLVMGDLNAAPDSAVLRPLREVLIDAWSAGGGDPRAVTLPSSHPSAPFEAGPELVDQRIDHIFFRAGQEDQHVLVEGAALGGEAVDGVFPSDHRAVTCDFRWKNVR